MSSIVPTLDATTPELPASSAAEPTSVAPTQAPSSAAPSSASPSPTQQPTSQPPSQEPSQSATTTSQEPEPSQSEQPPSSQAPESSSAAPESSAPPSSSEAAPSSSEAASSAAPESSAAPASSAVIVESSSTSEVASSTISSAESLSAPTTLTNTLTSTDANGVVYTITQTVRNGNTGQSSAAAGNTPFLENTGAVAGTFVAVGLVITAGVIAFTFFMLRRRRRQRLDRDVAAAAAAAGAASHHKGYDDEDDQGPAMTQYGGYYQSQNGIETLDHPQPRMDYDYEDPSGGYDHYANGLAPGDRMSTATAAGMAGFGAHSASQTYTGEEGYEHHDQLQHQQQYGDHQQYDASQPQYDASQQHQYADESYNAVTTDTNLAAPTTRERQSNGYYFDPTQVNAFAADEPYAGYEDHAPPMPIPSHQRTGSAGSVAQGDSGSRGLKITNF